MKEYKHYLNGKYVNENKLLISPRDLGFSRGYGVFDYIRTYNCKPFKLIDHIKRLLNSADLINLKYTFTVDEIARVINNLLEINNDGREKSIRIILSGGVSDSMYQKDNPTIVIFMDPFKSKDPEIYTKGVVLNTVKYKRDIPEAKSLNYIEGIKQANKNKEIGFFEPLYYSDDQVFETSNSNIFVIKDNILYTPKNNVFNGAARGVILKDLRDWKSIEMDFDLSFLLDADEIFLASSGKEIAPVIKIDDHTINDGKVGDITKKIIASFKDFIGKKDW